MEFPTAMLGVALGVVLMPQLAAARAAKDDDRYSAMLDWGLRLVVLLSVPCALALLVFSRAAGRGAVPLRRLQRVRRAAHAPLALMGYGVGLVGLVAIKVLAPGYYAKHDMRTPMLIAVGGAGADAAAQRRPGAAAAACGAHADDRHRRADQRAAGCWSGLLRRGSYRPRAGLGPLRCCRCWRAPLVLAALLVWGSQHFDWIGLQAQRLHRIGLLAALGRGRGAAVFRGAGARGRQAAQLCAPLIARVHAAALTLGAALLYKAT